MGRYMDIAKQFEAKHSAIATASWPCRHCGNPAILDEVCRSLDGQRWLTLWRCDRCQTHGCTPDAVRQPPVWIPRTEQ